MQTVIELFKSTLLLLIVTLFSCNNSEVQTDHTDSDSHLITDYGDFVPGKDDAATIATNHATINGAIVELGQAGGGTLMLPEGTFYIGPDPTRTPDDLSDDYIAITIKHSNITICGAGIDKTILKTNGTFVNDAFKHGPYTVGGRGHGIELIGSKDANSPLKNIVLKDFELDGQAGWNGDYSLSYKHGSENGWDMWHKGIIVSNNLNVDSITLENLYVHSYRGEVLYSGGSSVGKLTVKNCKTGDTNASCFNLWGAELLVEGCDFGDEACRFWVEFCARPGPTVNQTNKAVFRNNNFHSAKEKGGGISITQGDRRPYSIIFEGNTIDALHDVVACHGGVEGPVEIINNNIKCGGEVFHTFAWPGWAVSPINANILIENNTVTEGDAFASFNVFAQDIVVRNNTFTGIDEHSKSIEYGIGTVENIVVEGNSFINCLPPKENHNWTAPDGYTEEFTRPLFKDNTYTDEIRKERHAYYYVLNELPVVTPYYEYMEIGTVDADAVPVFETDGYPDGQIIEVKSPAWSGVKLPAGQESYYVAEERFLKYGQNVITFRFDAAKKQWIEVIEEK